MDPPNQYDALRIEYQEAFYGNEKDVPKTSRSYGGREFKLKSKKASDLPVFDPMGENSRSKQFEHQGQAKPGFRSWQIATPPPNRKEVEEWLGERKRKKNPDLICQADPGELDQFSQVGFKYTVLR